MQNLGGGSSRETIFIGKAMAVRHDGSVIGHVGRRSGFFF